MILGMYCTGGKRLKYNICQQEHLERIFYSFEQKRHLSHIKQVRLYLPPAALRTVDVFSGLEITNLWEWEQSSFWFRSGLVSVCLQLLDKKKNKSVKPLPPYLMQYFDAKMYLKLL